MKGICRWNLAGAIWLFAATTIFAQTQAVETWLYDNQGKNVGIEARVDGVTLVVHSVDDSILNLDGMPTVAVEKEPGTSRDADIAVGGTKSVTFRYDQRGYLRSVGMTGATLEMGGPSRTGLVTEILRDGHGKPVVEASVSGDKPSLTPNPPFCIDPIRQKLNLGTASSPFHIRPIGDSTSVVTGSDGTVLFYVVTFGGNRFGFDRNGKPLFIDVAVHLVDSWTRANEHSAVAIHEMTAVVPDRVVIAADGSVGACVSGPAESAIAAFWTHVDGKGSAVSYRRKDVTANPKSRGSAPPSGASSRRSLQPVVSGTSGGFCLVESQTTTYSDGTQVYTYLGTECYLYDTSTAPPASGGGSTTGGGSNQITGDAALRAQVSSAITNAQAHLPKCSSFLLALHAGNGSTLAQVLAGKPNAPAGGWTLLNFMTVGPPSGQTFTMTTDVNPYCAAGYPAFTSLYQNSTSICEREFNTFTSSMTTTDQWAVLIHEELHCLGYPERSGAFPDAQTPGEITQMIKSNCQ